MVTNRSRRLQKRTNTLCRSLQFSQCVIHDAGAIDDDHDGKVDKGELMRLMTRVGEPLDEDEIEEFFKHAPHVNANTIAINK